MGHLGTAGSEYSDYHDVLLSKRLLGLLQATTQGAYPKVRSVWRSPCSYNSYFAAQNCEVWEYPPCYKGTELQWLIDYINYCKKNGRLAAHFGRYPSILKETTDIQNVFSMYPFQLKKAYAALIWYWCGISPYFFGFRSISCSSKSCGSSCWGIFLSLLATSSCFSWRRFKTDLRFFPFLCFLRLLWRPSTML